MAEPTLERIDEFDSKAEEWSQYQMRLEYYLQANGVTDADKKKAVLITVVGRDNFKLMRSLIQPAEPKDKTFKQLVECMQKHFEPKPSESMQRLKFHSRSRRQGETVAAFVSELRAIAKDCNFGSKEQLEVMLRDRMVCGIANEKIQTKLLAEKNLTYETALSLSLSMEGAEKGVKELQNLKVASEAASGLSTSVHRVSGAGDKFKPAKACFRCGRKGHSPDSCRFKDVTCHGCNRKGHLKPVCPDAHKKAEPEQKPHYKRKNKKVHSVKAEETESDYPLCHITATVQTTKRSPPLEVDLQVDEKPLRMELDTGAALSLVNEVTYRQLWPDKKLESSRVRLTTYSGAEIPVLGSREVCVLYCGQEVNLPLIVVKGDGPSLFGRNWLDKIKVDWHAIHQVVDGALEEVLLSHKDIFMEGLGTLKGFKAKLSVDPQANPKYCRARSVPYSMNEKVESELQRLVAEGTLEPVQFSDWASPIVSVLKPSGDVRICGDFKQTVNLVSKLDRYPIPRVEDLFAKLKGGQLFTHLDLSQAYQQLPLDEDSKKYVVINTHKGLFRFNRLPYGISSAPGIFQRVMENLLEGIPGVVVYIDDILITGPTIEQHLKSLDEVLSRLENAGLLLRRVKCKFLQPSITFLGHKVDAAGLHPLTEKVEAIQQAPRPTNVTELKSYLGLLSYYSKFLPNMSMMLGPLYKLLRKDGDWKWGGEEKAAFEASKELILSSELLVHFDPKLPIILACDASSYGVGAVLAHRMPDGTERPIGFASRTLNKAEKNYAQIEREGLACVFGVKRFHSYLFGHSFELVTDHKPLLTLLNQHKSTSEQASARIRRWALFLSTYEYTIQFKKTEKHGNADALSRLPLPVEPKDVPTPAQLVLLIRHLDDSPVTVSEVRTLTRKDPTLALVLQYVLQGWPEKCAEQLKPYFRRRHELSAHEGCLLWGARVIIPPAARQAVLSELHEGHPGCSRMKSLARMYLWWPGLDAEIEGEVNSCQACQIVQPSPPAAPLHPWNWPGRPWSRLHIDFAGPLEGGRMLLILVDAHSKWIEVFPTRSSTSAVVIENLRRVFSQFGLPEVLVSDNGSAFVSEEFNQFLLKNGVKQVTSAPYHPATNGLAERAVQTVKKGLRKDTVGTLESRLSRFLMSYRLTPQSTTGISPAELLLGRRPRSRLDLLKPHLADRVEARQRKQQQTHDATARDRRFQVGDKVYSKHFGQGQRWVPGTIAEVTGPVSFLVKLVSGQLVRRHQDQIRIRKNDHGEMEIPQEEEEDIQMDTAPTEPAVVTHDSSDSDLDTGELAAPEPTTTTEDVSTPTASVPPTPGRTPVPPGATKTPIRKSYPQRSHQPPNWFDGPRGKT